MTDRRFIGPNGAHFSRSEPLPGWLEQMLDSGEVTEAKPAKEEKPKPPRKTAKTE